MYNYRFIIMDFDNYNLFTCGVDQFMVLIQNMCNLVLEVYT